MSIDARFSSREREEPAVLPVSDADVAPPAPPALPRLKTFEELGLHPAYRKAVEEELSRDEKVVWVGRPSQGATPPPPKAIFLTIGGVLLGLAVLLPVAFSVSLIIPVALGAFGLFFLFAPTLFKGGNAYHACYVVTNRRALLCEKGLLGFEPGMIPSWKDLTGVRCKSYYPHQLLGMERQSSDTVPGAGDLIFEYIFVAGRGVTNFPGTTGKIMRTDTPQRVPRGFFYVERAAEVEELIRATLLTNLEKSIDERGGAAPAARPAREERPSPSGPTCACGAALPAADERADQPATCPACGSALVVPSRAAAKVAPPGRYLEDGDVPEALKQKVLAELGSNEHLVWVAQPVGTIVFRRSLGYLAVGGIIAAIALWVIVSALLGPSAASTTAKAKAAAAKKGAAGKKAAQAPQPHAQPASRGFGWTSIFFLVGGLCCAGVPLYRWKMAQGTVYALTNRRALVFRPGLFGPGRESYSPVEVAQMRRADSWLFEGGGDVIFRTVVTVKSSSSRHGSGRSVTTTHYGFLAVEDVKGVEKLVRETLIDPFVDRLQAANSW